MPTKNESTRQTRLTRLGDLKRRAHATGACLVQIYGKQLGRKWEIGDQDFTIGREDRNDLVIESDAVSRRHARIEQTNGAAIIDDLGSLNGTYINDVAAKHTPLAHGDLIKVGDTIFKFLAEGNLESAYHEEIYRMTIIDGLTEIHNKRYLVEFVAREMSRCERYGRALSLVMFDIDHFKQVNDAHGHLAGDQVIRAIAATVRDRIRREECFARYGGEEFAIVLPETPHDGAVTFAEKIRLLIAELDVTFEDLHIPVTVSLGVSTLSPELKTVPDFIKEADERLYLAKNQGRNRVVG